MFVVLGVIPLAYITLSTPSSVRWTPSPISAKSHTTRPGCRASTFLASQLPNFHLTSFQASIIFARRYNRESPANQISAQGTHLSIAISIYPRTTLYSANPIDRSVLPPVARSSLSRPQSINNTALNHNHHHPSAPAPTTPRLRLN